MHSPDRMQALAHLRAASLPLSGRTWSGRTWPVRTMSMMPPMTSTGLCLFAVGEVDPHPDPPPSRGREEFPAISFLPLKGGGIRWGSMCSPAASVIGQTSTHLPQRVQASAMAWARASKAASNVATAGSAAFCEVLCITALADLLLPAYSRASGTPDNVPSLWNSPGSRLLLGTNGYQS